MDVDHRIQKPSLKMCENDENEQFFDIKNIEKCEKHDN